MSILFQTTSFTTQTHTYIKAVHINKKEEEKSH